VIHLEDYFTDSVYENKSISLVSLLSWLQRFSFYSYTLELIVTLRVSSWVVGKAKC